MQIILQKIIAESGYSSRRQAEKLIRQGAVKINGRTATLGETGDSVKDIITVKNKPIAKPAQKIYLKLNKPTGYVCTNRRFPGEKNIFSLVPIKARLFVVGRLDKDSRGLVLLTNDGTLAQKLSHPKFGKEKIYEVRTRMFSQNRDENQRIFKHGDQAAADNIKKSAAISERLLQGVDIGGDEGLARAKAVKYLQNGLFIITLNEGRKRQIRRMFQALGLAVIDLKRVAIAGLALGALAEKHWAYLNKEEINQLKT